MRAGTVQIVLKNLKGLQNGKQSILTEPHLTPPLGFKQPWAAIQLPFQFFFFSCLALKRLIQQS